MKIRHSFGIVASYKLSWIWLATDVLYDLLYVFCHVCGEVIYFGFCVIIPVLLLVDLVSVIEDKAQALSFTLIFRRIGGVVAV